MKNTELINKRIELLIKDTHDNRRFSLLYDVETFDIEDLIKKQNFVWLVKTEKGISFSNFINNIALTLRINVSLPSYEKLERIKRFLELLKGAENYPVIIVQDAQNLTTKQLCIVRHLYDSEVTSIILLSDKKFKEMLINARKRNAYKTKSEQLQVLSRLFPVFNFESFKNPDTEAEILVDLSLNNSSTEGH